MYVWVSVSGFEGVLLSISHGLLTKISYSIKEGSGGLNTCDREKTFHHNCNTIQQPYVLEVGLM